MRAYCHSRNLIFNQQEYVPAGIARSNTDTASSSKKLSISFLKLECGDPSPMLIFLLIFLVNLFYIGYEGVRRYFTFGGLGCIVCLEA